MIRYAIVFAFGVAAGWFALGKINPPAAAPSDIPRPGEARSGAWRISRDFRQACVDLDPLMAAVQRSYADDNLSPQEALSILQEVRRLTG